NLTLQVETFFLTVLAILFGFNLLPIVREHRTRNAAYALALSSLSLVLLTMIAVHGSFTLYRQFEAVPGLWIVLIILLVATVIEFG
ncbi:hypothetical protein PMAYCL1PPCAC_19172, partial [Pristionchus mayeri]